jgi:hypothetical protein
VVARGVRLDLACIAYAAEMTRERTIERGGSKNPW